MVTEKSKGQTSPEPARPGRRARRWGAVAAVTLASAAAVGVAAHQRQPDDDGDRSVSATDQPPTTVDRRADDTRQQAANYQAIIEGQAQPGQLIIYMDGAAFITESSIADANQEIINPIVVSTQQGVKGFSGVSAEHGVEVFPTDLATPAPDGDSNFAFPQYAGGAEQFVLVDFDAHPVNISEIQPAQLSQGEVVEVLDNGLVVKPDGSAQTVTVGRITETQ